MFAFKYFPIYCIQLNLINHKGNMSEQEQIPTLSKEEKVQMIDSMLKYYDDLPPSALVSSATNYDLKAVYLMIKSLI